MANTSSNHELTSAPLPASDYLQLGPWQHGETLAAIVLQCLQQTSNSLQHRSELLQSAVNFFLSSQSHPSVIPDRALLEGLLTLCSVSDVASDAEICLLLLSVSSPASWEFVTTFPSPVLYSHLSSVLLDTYIGKAINETGSINSRSRKCLHDTLNRVMSNLDSWESRGYLTITPKTPFSLALKAALLKLDSGDERQSKSFQRSSLFGLVTSSQLSDWEAVSDDDAHRLLSVWPESVPLSFEKLLRQRKCSLTTSSHSTAVLELLCTVPELAYSLNRQPTTAQRAMVLAKNVYDGKLSTAAVHTLLKGLSDTAAVYSTGAFLALQTFLNSIAIHAKNDGNVDATLVVNIIDFLLGEGRAENGIPDSFAPIAKALLNMAPIAAMNDRNMVSELRKSLKQIAKGHITCTGFTEHVRRTERDLDRIVQEHDLIDGS